MTVPGMVSAWFHLHRTRARLPVATLLEPAIGLAEGGFPRSPAWESIRRRHRAAILTDPGIAAWFEGGERPLRAGEPLRQADLAESLRLLAREGPEAFYAGPLGERIAAAIAERGGLLALGDLREHGTEEVEPLAIDLRAGRLLEQPPVSQGAMVAVLLAALDEADRRGWRIDDGSPRAIAREIHLQAEIYRRERATRDRLLCDPRFWEQEQEQEQASRFARWLEPAHAAGTVDRIDPERVVPLPGSPAREEGDTTYLCAADRDGNVVSWIQSVFHPYGAGFVVPGTGILLNNRMNGFSPHPGSPNRPAPGKRPVHTLNSWIVLRQGEPWLAGGTPGAERQITTNVQVLRSRLAGGRPLAEAIEAPRWMLDDADRLAIEGRGPAEARRCLKRMGHAGVRLGPWQASGFVQALERLPSGGWIACADPRGEGLAVGS